MTEYQRNLFEQTVLTPQRLSHAEAFQRFTQRNPWFMPRLAELAYEQKARGARRISAKYLFEIVRPEVVDSAGKFHLDNSWSGLAARRLLEDYEGFDGLIELRRRVSA